MTVTKSQLRTRVLQMADAVGSTRWDTAANGEVDIHIGVAFDREWKRILNANKHYRVNRVSVTSDSAGYYTLASLTTGTADTTKRLYRVLALAVDSIVYEQTDIQQYLMPATDVPQPNYLWYFEDVKILALPVTPSKAATIVVNWIPPRQESLSGESVAVDFPDGYENVVAWSAAAMLLMSKAGAESGAAQILELQAEQLRKDMLQDLARQSTKPIRMEYTDSVNDWAG